MGLPSCCQIARTFLRFRGSPPADTVFRKGRNPQGCREFARPVDSVRGGVGPVRGDGIAPQSSPSGWRSRSADVDLGGVAGDTRRLSRVEWDTCRTVPGETMHRDPAWRLPAPPAEETHSDIFGAAASAPFTGAAQRPGSAILSRQRASVEIGGVGSEWFNEL
jgi:hypothetical protein